MTGIFSSAAELYGQHGIPTIPLRIEGKDKGPLISGFKISELTVGHSRAYAARMPDAKGVGVPDGPLSGIVRLDVDEPGDAIVSEVIRRAGDTPAKARTASGKIHLWYRNNGERRLTGKPGSQNARPWDDLKVDLCGQGGYSIVPPSERDDGAKYELLGDAALDDVLRNRRQLPTIAGLQARAYFHSAEAIPLAPANDEPRRRFIGYEDLRLVQIGDRDAALYPIVARAAKRLFNNGGSYDALVLEARDRNTEFPVPLTDDEVVKKCGYWWQATLEGKNRFSEGRRRQGGKLERVVSIDEEAFAAIAPLGADAFMLYAILRKQHWGASFAVANDMRFKMPDGLWTEPRFKKARDSLLGADIIKPHRPPNYRGHKAALYRWR
jgi:Bifunctional DNA primase/polymerase, N-terminal